MTDKFGLKAKVIEEIQKALSAFPEIKVAVLYGSRAKGNYKTGSDIDLTLKTADEISERLLFRVMHALDNLDLPYSFDISIFDQLDNSELIDHINRVGVEFYNANDYSVKKQKQQ